MSKLAMLKGVKSLSAGLEKLYVFEKKIDLRYTFLKPIKTA